MPNTFPGIPLADKAFRNSIVSISKPKLPSIMRRTISAILETSIMLARESAGHSKKVSLLCLEVTTVSGPLGEERLCLV